MKFNVKGISLFLLLFFPSLVSGSGIGWTSIGSLGTFSQNTSTAAWTVQTTATLEAGNAAFCLWASDNDGDGTDTNDFTTMSSVPSSVWSSSCSVSAGVIGASCSTDVENETDPGANNAGAAVAIFWTVATVDLATGSFLTINNATAETARAGTCWEFDISDNGLIKPDGDPGHPWKADDTADATLLVASTTAAGQNLFIRAIASETTNGDITTLSSGFTKITAATANSGTEATSMGIVGEFLITTSLNVSSDPTMTDTSADRASVFEVFDEIGTVPSEALGIYTIMN